MKITSYLLGLLCLFATTVFAAEAPFTINVTLEQQNNVQQARVTATISTGKFIYAEHWQVQGLAGTKLTPVSLPKPATIYDTFSEQNKEVYTNDFIAVYNVEEGAGGSIQIEVAWQGCDQTTCFMPETKVWTFNNSAVPASKIPAAVAKGPAAPAAWETLANKFRVVGQDSGYMTPSTFIKFLTDSLASTAPSAAGTSPLSHERPWVAICLILVGGLLLNFTPCVLPMIPINLAIIGAGARAGSRKRGLLLGAAYGLGLASTYGILGLVVVLTGSTFGTLNSSPWFNLAIALVFLILSLAMFEVFAVDFSRFQGRFSTAKITSFGGGLWPIFFMGIIAALLAGACVAPVVISVILWSQKLYSSGLWVGLLLPFILGIGMALPWPFAGAGLSFLPKPGTWMVWVRNGFGVLILLMAIYYGYTGLHQLHIFDAKKTAEVSETSSPELANALLAEKLQTALKEGKPVFIDFWASWCKNCLAMDATTFASKDVQKELSKFVVIKYVAEKPEDPATKAVLDHFDVKGLPTFIILK